MENKEIVRVTAVKAVATLIPMMATRPLLDNIFF